MSHASLAFMLVALCYLQPEADYYTRQLNLPCPSVLERTNLMRFDIMGGRDRLSGSLLTTNYVFHFTECGRLFYLKKRQPRDADAHIREYHNRLARQYSALDTNSAYQLATQWLAAVGVDIQQMEKKYPHQVTFPELDRPVKVTSPEGKTLKVKIVPEFWVTWGKKISTNFDNSPPYAAEVEVLGPTGELANVDIHDQSLSTRPCLEVPGQLVLEELSNEAFTNLWKHRELSATNVFGLLRTSTAYQSVMVQRMLDEANWAVSQLGLPSGSQLKLKDLTDSFVAPPQFGFRGCVWRRNESFQFDEFGKLKYIFYARPEELARDTSSREYYEEMSRHPMLVDSNSVVELATGWLRALQVDVDALNRVTQPVADRYMFARKRPSHLWWVTWPEPKKLDRPYLVVVVDGTTKLPNRIRLNQPAYATRPGIGIPNAEELMKTPDSSPQKHPLMAHLNVLAAP